MATPPVGFINATFVLTYSGVLRECTWSMGFEADDFATLGPGAMAAEIRAEWIGSGRPYNSAAMVTGWTFAGVRVTKMLVDGPLTGESINPVVGGFAGTPVPINTTMLFRKNTSGGGRRNKGRAYVPSTVLTEASVDGAGVINPGNMAGTQALFTTALTATIAAGYEPRLFHTEAPFTPTVIDTFTLESQMATQRRRMRR